MGYTDRVEVIVGAEAVKWLKRQPTETQAAVLALLTYLRLSTYAELSEPRAKPLLRSRHRGAAWELRDLSLAPERHLRVLVYIHGGELAWVAEMGDKTGNWQSWYEVAIPTADQRYDDFLRRRSTEGTQP